MDRDMLKSITVELNARTLYPELENCLSQYAKDIQTTMSTIRNISKKFPHDLEPSLIFNPGK